MLVLSLAFLVHPVYLLSPTLLGPAPIFGPGTSLKLRDGIVGCKKLGLIHYVNNTASQKKRLPAGWCGVGSQV